MNPIFSIAVLLALAGSACDRRGGIEPAGLSHRQSSKLMKMDPPEFAKVATDSLEQNPCSPADPGLAWRGVTIRMPGRVSFEKGSGCTLLPVCGFYRIDATAETNDGFLLFVKNLADGKVVSARIVDTDPSPEEPPPEAEPLDPKLFEGVSTAGYFNVDLVQFVPLAPETATYEVHIEFAGFRSNVAKVELVAE